MPALTTWSRRLVALACALAPLAAVAADAPKADAPVSYYKQVRPLLQAHCQGCHQPAKAGGDYVMTDFARLLAGGETKVAAVVPSEPEESLLIDQITPDEEGEAAMPQGKPALPAPDRELIARWIAQGAADDTPANAVNAVDMEHPPAYTRPPVIAGLDFSPDGTLLAVGGFHEVLLWKADGSELLARLVGLSERIESVKFSPDGSKLAVVGGLPGRMGEVQVWDVPARKLVLSAPVTFDTLYGASWSPDGSKIAFGCTDNAVRAIDAKTGAQVLFMGSHDDWPLGTAFSHDGAHLSSVGRDGTSKLTEVATQRFVDNITSITPGALKGGIASVAGHPARGEILFGGADGVPKLYRIQRQAARMIGDDSNHILSFEPMRGRVTGVALSRDGARVAAVSSLDAAGEVRVYAVDYVPHLTDALKAIQFKVPATRTAEENAALAKFAQDSIKPLAKLGLPQTGLYAVAFRPDGAAVAVAGGDGTVRLIDAEKGAILKEFVPVALTGEESTSAGPVAAAAPLLEDPVESEALPEGAKIVGLEVDPPAVQLAGRFAYVQLLVTGKTADGDRIDLTRLVEPRLSADVAEVGRTGLVRPKADGQAALRLSLGEQAVDVPVLVAGTQADVRADFVQDVAPVLSRLGCNAGTCHGSAQGKKGFKLSLRGYDPIFDVRALTDDHAARRVNLASPDDSLMLLKPTNGVPHVGGALMRPDEPYYQVIRAWIAGGARLDAAPPRVAKIEVTPLNPIVQKIGTRQQLRVLATYTTGEVRDVTREAFLESGNTEVATANRSGLMTSLRRGEAPILARFEGAYAATTLTVMGDRTGFAWEAPEAYGRIDELTAAKWERMKILPSGLCTDAEFLRRAYLDLTGLPPTADEVRAFLADPTPSRRKREAVIDRLMGSDAYIDYWTNKWADLLQVNRKFLEVDGATAFRKWIRDQVAANVPYDRFVRTIITASGSNKDNPAASYYKILREPTATMENTTQLFLAVRFNCNKCHDHPFERWTQDQYYQTAAYFAQVGLKKDEAGGNKMIGGTAVEGAKPLYEEVFDRPDGEVVHDRTKAVTPPKFPYEVPHAAPEKPTRRTELAAWLTSKDNPYFARSYVNRLWGYLFGVGIIEPLDDIRAGNPPSNPELLDYLTKEFIDSGFNSRHVIRLIVTSRTYQLSVATNTFNADDKINYSHAVARRLPAEVLLDAVYRVTGSQSKFPGVAPGTRAAALPDSGVELPSGFLTTFGRPARESACECERTSGLQLGPVMALISGPTLGDAIADPGNELTRLVGVQADDRQLVNELFLRILNRAASAAEIDACLGDFGAVEDDHRKLAEALGKKEVEVALARPQQEREHAAELARARAGLAAYEVEIAPKVAEAKKQQDEKVAALEADLKTYEATIPAKVAEWEKAQSAAVRWRTLEPTELAGPNGAKLAKGPDGSVIVEGNNGNGTYTITADTDLTDITGIRLEVLTDDKLPSKGPGRAPDGNFVLTELEVTAAPKADPKAAQPVKLQTPLADFTQANFNIAAAIDGDRTNQGAGWAVSPATGTVHWATLETAQPLGAAGGTRLTIKLHHAYAGNIYTLGRFRLSVTRLPKPLGLGVPDTFRDYLATAPELRTDAQREMVLNYFRAIDADRRAKLVTLEAAKAPIPVDPKLQALREEVASLEKPLPIDPQLARLRADVEQSIKQAASRRLTAAQDVAWALINSPAFLFNH